MAVATCVAVEKLLLPIIPAPAGVSVPYVRARDVRGAALVAGTGYAQTCSSSGALSGALAVADADFSRVAVSTIVARTRPAPIAQARW
jgi:hypothetical protein